MENFTDLQVSAQAYSSAESQSLLLTDDSLGYDYSLEIWPKGVFSFSQDKGFVGEAEKLMVTGTGVQTSVMQLQQNLELQDGTTNNSGLTKSGVETTNMEQVAKESSPSWKWMMVMGVVLLVVIAGLVVMARQPGL